MGLLLEKKLSKELAKCIPSGPRVFLMSFTSKRFIDVAYRLKEKGVSIVYWTGGRSCFDAVAKERGDFPGTVFHNIYDATRAIPAPDMLHENFKPVSAELISQMLSCESQVLGMMNSIDQDNEISVIERKNIYYEYLRYWHGTLEMHKPDAVLFHDIPHLAHNFVVYHLAKLMGIQTVMCDTVKRLPDRVMFFEDFERYERIKNEYEKICGQNFTLKDLSPDLQVYYRNQTNPVFDATPAFKKQQFVTRVAQNLRLFPGIGVISRNIEQRSFFKTAFNYTKMLFNKKNALSLKGDFHRVLFQKIRYRKWNRIKNIFKKEYECLQTKVDYSQKFIYVPLHSQPERSTSAEGGIFSDQILLVHTLAAALPKDWFLYVKESSWQWTFPRTQVGRFRGYYEKMAEIKNVRLIPADTSTYELIAHCVAVASVTGTAGWEALLRGKPALVFGYTWYIHCDGAFEVRDVASCSDALAKIEKGYSPNSDLMIKFLGALDRISVRGYDNHNFNKNSFIPEESNVQIIADGFLKTLSK